MPICGGNVLDNDYYRINNEFSKKLSDLEVALQENKLDDVSTIYREISPFVTRYMTPYLEKNMEDIYEVGDELKELINIAKSEVTGSTNVKILRTKIDKIKRNIHSDISKSNSIVTNETVSSKPEDNVSTNLSDKTIREKFESHPVVFGGSLLITGLLAGVAVMKFIPASQQTLTKNSIFSSDISIKCTVDGLPSFSNAHNHRVVLMQEKLMELETQASDRDIIPSYQVKYLESSNRLRKDIDTENTIFKDAVRELDAKCKKVSNERNP